MGTSSGETRKRKDNFSVPMQRIGSKPRKTRNEDDNSMEQYFKYLMVQRQLDHDERKEEQRIKREEQELRREEQERIQEKRREEQELRREDERLRHEQQLNMMQMMMLGFLGGQRNMQQPMPIPYPAASHNISMPSYATIPPVISVRDSHYDSEVVDTEVVDNNKNSEETKSINEEK